MFLASMAALWLLAHAQAGPAAAIDACHSSAAAADDAPLAEGYPPMSAFCFVLAIYAEDHFKQLDPLGEDAERLFSRAALADLAEARRQSPDASEVRPPANPLCRCGEPALMYLLTTGVALDGEGKVVGTAVLTTEAVDESLGLFGILARLPPESRVDVRLALVREPGGWRIDDITYGDGSSFREMLSS